jgi:uncharacterized protein YbjT (DUF2867 family)
VKVLIAAPTGYVGRQLLRRLEREQNVELRVVAADVRHIRTELGPRIEIVEDNLFDPATMQRAVQGVDVAYYPIRLASQDRGFEERASVFARMFRDACIDAGVGRIVHLGVRADAASAQRLSALAPDALAILGARPDRIRTLCVSAGVIVGPGSVLFEMVMRLVKNWPVLVIPRWAKAEIEPVALSDVVEYLARAATLPVEKDVVIEIGAQRMSVRDFFELAARIHGSRRLMVPVPVALPRLSAFFLALATPLSIPLALALVRVLLTAQAADTGRSDAQAVHPFPDLRPLSCEDAIAGALAAADADDIESRWTDSLVDFTHRSSESAMGSARYRDQRRLDFGHTAAAKVFESVLAVGGEEGWFTFDILWRMRGLLDKFLGGFGTSLGRRSATELRVGDMLDVWRVVDLVANERLLLQAQMNVFGDAWLEFRLQGTTLVQTAYYKPDGVLGQLYWYSMMPFHAIIFPNMASSIVRRAARY